ncbi:MAG: DUF6455 family protein [Pseudomonadota bacterium]
MTVHNRSLGDADRHFWINRSLARSLDVNLSEAMMEKDLTAKEYAMLVTRCRACQNVESCVSWLANCSARSDCAPDFCPNAETFNRLAQAKAKRKAVRN